MGKRIIKLKCENCGVMFETSIQSKTVMLNGGRGIMCKECRLDYSRKQSLRRWRIKHKKVDTKLTFKEQYEKRTGNKLKLIN